jgi:hypothetical protein
MTSLLWEDYERRFRPTYLHLMERFPTDPVKPMDQANTVHPLRTTHDTSTPHTHHRTRTTRDTRSWADETCECRCRRCIGNSIATFTRRSRPTPRTIGTRSRRRCSMSSSNDGRHRRRQPQAQNRTKAKATRPPSTAITAATRGCALPAPWWGRAQKRVGIGQSLSVLV